MGQTVLVIAAHPDDEVLGCGGSIAAHSAAGDSVPIAILAEGATSRDASRDVTARKAELHDLAQAAERAAGVLGAASCDLLGLPDNGLDSLELLDLVKVVEELISRYRPSTVYTHHAGDVNIDHRLIHEAVFTACRPTPGHPVQRLLAFEVASSTESAPAHSLPPFVPNYFREIAAFLDRKLEALRKYSSEMRLWPHARSLEAITHLVRWRGATVGVEAAKAFVLLRALDRT